jgi:hypothetical protein
MNQKAEYYFSLRDAVYKEGETGYTKVEIHEIGKRYILPLLLDEDDNFDLDAYSIQDILKAPNLSTRWLSNKGWDMYIEQFKSFCNDSFGIGL